MDIANFLYSLLSVLNAMSPYLLLGFLIAGVLHVFVPKRFYAKYLSHDNKWSVLWAAPPFVPLTIMRPKQPSGLRVLLKNLLKSPIVQKDY